MRLLVPAQSPTFADAHERRVRGESTQRHFLANEASKQQRARLILHCVASTSRRFRCVRLSAGTICCSRIDVCPSGYPQPRPYRPACALSDAGCRKKGPSAQHGFTTTGWSTGDMAASSSSIRPRIDQACRIISITARPKENHSNHPFNRNRHSF